MASAPKRASAKLVMRAKGLCGWSVMMCSINKFKLHISHAKAGYLVNFSERLAKFNVFYVMYAHFKGG